MVVVERDAWGLDIWSRWSWLCADALGMNVNMVVMVMRNFRPGDSDAAAACKEWYDVSTRWIKLGGAT